MPISIRILGIQHNPLFQQCVEAAQHLEKEHKHQGWKAEVVRNFEYQFDRERSKLLALNQQQSIIDTDTEVIVILNGKSDDTSAEQTILVFANRIMNGDDFIQYALDNSDFRLFTNVADSDPQSYLSLARLNHRRFLKSTGCHFSWMLIKHGDIPLGRIVFQLFSDKAPRTCQNFLYLCRGDLPAVENATITDKESGEERKESKVELTYKGSRVFRVVPNGWIQAGDILPPKLGNGGYSIYGQTFPDETFEIEHDDEGIVGMSNDGEHTNSSSFYITCGRASWMNKRYVAFGRVVEGLKVLRALKELKTKHNQAPVDDVIIADCGEVNTEE